MINEKERQKDKEMLKGFITEKKPDYNLSDYISPLTQSREVESVFTTMKSEQIGSIKEAIDDINDLIEKREQLQKDIFSDVDKAKAEINNMLGKFTAETTPAEQLNLRKKQMDFEDIKIQEKLNKWRDIALLKKELRETLREFREKESRASMLDTILTQ